MVDSRIISGSSKDIEIVSQLLNEAFRVDPALTYLMPSLSVSERELYRPHFFKAVVTESISSHAYLSGIDDWKSCAIVFPPGFELSIIRAIFSGNLVSIARRIRVQGCQRLLGELRRFSDTSKGKCLRKGEKFYYVFFLGTEDASRGKGLCSTLVRHYQRLARQDQASLYLEASNEHACGLYKKLGFVVVNEELIGTGKAAADGTALVGGPGLKLWGMIWRPE